jgi:hypothetical protein
MRRWPRAALPAALLLAGCAAKAPPAVDLAEARRAVEAARAAGAAERAAEPLARAQSHLEQAEALAARAGRPVEACQADGLGRLAVAEASCAETLARAAAPAEAAARPAESVEAERLAARLRRSDEEVLRLEERVTLLQRDLDITETEVIRTKARLKGTATKAEASSAIAEARILVRRLGDARGPSASLARGQELIAKAEELLDQENFSAAAFFALRAQEVATKAPAVRDTAERTPPQPRYVVRAAVANIRRGPGTGEPVVGRAPRGAQVVALAVRWEWVKVTHAGVTGWIHGSLLE